MKVDPSPSQNRFSSLWSAAGKCPLLAMVTTAVNMLYVRGKIQNMDYTGFWSKIDSVQILKDSNYNTARLWLSAFPLLSFIANKIDPVPRLSSPPSTPQLPTSRPTSRLFKRDLTPSVESDLQPEQQPVGATPTTKVAAAIEKTFRDLTDKYNTAKRTLSDLEAKEAALNPSVSGRDELRHAHDQVAAQKEVVKNLIKMADGIGISWPATLEIADPSVEERLPNDLSTMTQADRSLPRFTYAEFLNTLESTQPALQQVKPQIIRPQSCELSTAEEKMQFNSIADLAQFLDDLKKIGEAELGSDQQWDMPRDQRAVRRPRLEQLANYFGIIDHRPPQTCGPQNQNLAAQQGFFDKLAVLFKRLEKKMADNTDDKWVKDFISGFRTSSDTCEAGLIGWVDEQYSQLYGSFGSMMYEEFQSQIKALLTQHFLEAAKNSGLAKSDLDEVINGDHLPHIQNGLLVKYQEMHQQHYTFLGADSAKADTAALPSFDYAQAQRRFGRSNAGDPSVYNHREKIAQQTLQKIQPDSLLRDAYQMTIENITKKMNTPQDAESQILIKNFEAFCNNDGKKINGCMDRWIGYVHESKDSLYTNLPDPTIEQMSWQAPYISPAELGFIAEELGLVFSCKEQEEAMGRF